LRFNSFLLQA